MQTEITSGHEYPESELDLPRKLRAHCLVAGSDTYDEVRSIRVDSCSFVVQWNCSGMRAQRVGMKELDLLFLPSG
jgi:hypothetical protein